MGYSVWQNDLTEQVFRVSDNGDNKRQLTSQSVIDISLYFAGQSEVAVTNSSALRAWLNSYHTVV